MAVQSGVYRGVSAQDRAAQRRAQLMEATLAVWADAETRTTMTAVCASAGLTERYFYESFRSLDDALTAVMDQIATDIEESTRQAADEAGTDPSARVQASIRAFVELLVADPRKGRVAIIEASAMPKLRGRRTELLHHFAHRAAEEAHEMLGLPRRSERENAVAGLLFVGGMAELIAAWLDGTLEASPEQIVEAASRSFLGLYG
ncbi:TetR/AcrR family transcriptional regulator [Nocardioides ferulae]|uniref:TetR/AcrR family transcriptional regulator n=1 Tax=Nocardioides ferulae TaxID=2340821 RepID=UPI000EB289B8|nr:TetR/AcrR family transcriptional regulator [Nocardioides ferulae]